MNNRKYIREEGINSRTDGKGKIFAQKVYGENTEVHFIERFQGPERKYNSSGLNNRITVSITFTDIGCGMTSKYKDCYDYNESILVQYALDLMEYDTLEEYYKAVLLLTKNSLTRSVNSMDVLLAKYDAGEHAWPVTKKNVAGYRSSNETWRKVLSTLDITDADLKFFEQYKREGVNTGDNQFDY